MKKCKHNGGKGYWSNLPGFKCLKCGAEVIEKPKKKTPSKNSLNNKVIIK